MAREDAISGAVKFLQDPEAASAPMDKRIEFLRARNLTPEEIDLALARAGQLPQDPSPQLPQLPQDVAPFPSQQPQSFRRLPPAQRSFNPYADWSPPAAAPASPGPFRRDWRDWFVMATVASGATFALYTIAQRYIKPLIAPPTTPQIEKDKAAIDEQFSRAFALMDVLQEDTAAIKRAEEARTERLDKALAEVESVLAELKLSSKKRDEESNHINDEVQSLKRSIPKTLANIQESSEKSLKELNFELAALRSLVSIRPGTSEASVPASEHEMTWNHSPATDGLPGRTSALGSPDAKYIPMSAKIEDTGKEAGGSSRSESVTSPTDPNPWSRYTAMAAKAGQENSSEYGGSDKSAIPSWQASMMKNQAAVTGEDSSSRKKPKVPN